MNKKVIYVEPASYFNEDMRKAAREWEREHEADNKAAQEKVEHTIDDYKDRMTSPVKVTRIDPVTREPINNDDI